MKVTIISPTRNPMQSGQAKAGDWQIIFPAGAAPDIDPLTGWVSMPDTSQQLRLGFATKEQAIEYAEKNNLLYEVSEPKQRITKPKSYAVNFAYRKENRA